MDVSQRLPRIGDITALVLDEARPGVIPLRQMIGQAASSVALLEGERISQRYSSTIISAFRMPDDA